MTRLLQVTLVLFSLFIVSFSSIPPYPGQNTSSYEDYDLSSFSILPAPVDMSKVLVEDCLLSDISMISKPFLHPDYDLFKYLLDMTFNNGKIEVYKNNVKANLEVSPITLFTNLYMQRLICLDSGPNCYHNGRYEHTTPKLGELVTDLLVETYSQNLKNSNVLPQDLNQVEPYSIDPTLWKIPWLKKELVLGLLFMVNELERFSGKNLTDEEQMWLQSNNVDNILKVIGKQANDIVRSDFVLESLLNGFKSGTRLEYLSGLSRTLTEENLNVIINCWYDTERFGDVEEALGENLLILKALVEAIPKDRVEDIFKSWRKSLQNLNDMEEALNITVEVIHEKIQEFDMVRVIKLFKARVENVLGEMESANVTGGSLFQRVEKLSEMMEKAIWRMRAGLWPEMINFLDRLILGLKRREFEGNGLIFWTKIDSLLSPTYQLMKTEYHAALIKELFPNSTIKLGAGWSDFWGYILSNYGRDLEGKLSPILYNLLLNPDYNSLSQIESYVRQMNAVEWEKWIEKQLFESIGYMLISIRETSQRWLQQDQRSLNGFFLQDWEKIPKEFEDFQQFDWETYFVYFLHRSLKTDNYNMYVHGGLLTFLLKSHHDYFS